MTPDPPPVSPDPIEQCIQWLSFMVTNAEDRRIVQAELEAIRAARAADALRHQQEIAALERKQHDANCELRGPGGAVDRRCSCGFRALRAEIIAARAALSTAEAEVERLTWNFNVTVDERDAVQRQFDKACVDLSTAEATIQQLAAEVMAAINEPMYAGTRKAWVDRAYAAEARLSEVEAERDQLKEKLSLCHD